MQRRLRISGILLAALLLASACGGPTTAEARIGQGAASLAVTKPYAKLAKLVPADTDVLLYIPYPDGVVKEVETLTALFGEEIAAQVDPNQMFAQLGPVADEIDRAKPMAMAMAIPEGERAEPITTMLLPVKDAEKVVALFAEQQQDLGQEQQKPPTITDGYLVQVMGPPGTEPVAGPSPITKHVPQGDLVLRIDLGRMIERQGKTVREQLDQAIAKGTGETPPGMPDMSEIAKDAGQMAHDLLDSADYLDLSVDLDGTTVHLFGLFTAKEGSKLAEAPAASADLVNLAGAIPEDYPMVFLATVDWKKLLGPMQKLMDGMFETFPEEVRADLKTMWTKSVELYDYLGEKFVVGYKWDETGMSAIGAMEITDSKVYLEKWNALLDEHMGGLTDSVGMTFERLPPSKVAGFDVQNLRMDMDIAKMMEAHPELDSAPPEQLEAMQKMMDGFFGPDGWTMNMVDVSGVMISAMGLDEAELATAIQNVVAGKAPSKGPLATAIETAGGKPTFLARIELREFLRGTLDAVRKAMPPEQTERMPEIPPGDPVNLVIYACGDGRYYAGGFSMDVGAMKDLVELFGGQAGTASAPPPGFGEDMDDMDDMDDR